MEGWERLPHARRPHTAFVLSGGGSLGAVQAGMVHAIFERGIRADLFVGTSAGAINAAFLASRPQTVETARELARVWCSLRREDVFPVRMRSLVGGLRRKRDHLVSDHGLRALLRQHIELDRLEDASPPLHVVCFDLNEGCEVTLCSGPAREAVIASASIPGILPPVRIGNRRLIDGAVVNPAPVSHALALGAQRIYLLPATDPALPPARGVGHALDAALHGLKLLLHSRLEADLDRVGNRAELIVLPAANRRKIRAGDFGHGRALVDGALEASRHVLDRRAVGCADALAARR